MGGRRQHCRRGCCSQVGGGRHGVEVVCTGRQEAARKRCVQRAQAGRRVGRGGSGVAREVRNVLFYTRGVLTRYAYKTERRAAARRYVEVLWRYASAA